MRRAAQARHGLRQSGTQLLQLAKLSTRFSSKRMVRHCKLGIPIPFLCAAAIIGAGCSASSEAPTGETEQPFATGLSGDPIHERVTADGLYFLRPEIVVQLQALNVATDLRFILESRYHFDDCNFSQASATVRAEQAAAVEYLNPNDSTPQSTFRALERFARSLHIVQDFYAHTNWVESEAPGLLDQSLSEFPVLAPYSTLPNSNVVIVEGAVPKGTAVTRDHDAPYPENAVVRVQRRASRWLGLISGSVDYEPGDACPRQVRMTHDELNKDRSDAPDRTLQHEQAKALATQQTTHEWCRLRALTAARWGDAGVERLNTWVAVGSTAPTCSSTP